MSTIFNIDEWHKLCEEGGQIAATIHPSGVSMSPLIRGGKDSVIVMPLRRPLKRGDIVLFRRADGCDVMHRVWKIKAVRTDLTTSDDVAASGDVATSGNAEVAQIITFGDGCWYPDEPITQDKILGLAVTLRRAKSASAQPSNADSKKQAYRSINLDTSARRAMGRTWLFLSPLRRIFYRLRNAAHWLKRQLKKHA